MNVNICRPSPFSDWCFRYSPWGVDLQGIHLGKVKATTEQKDSICGSYHNLFTLMFFTYSVTLLFTLHQPGLVTDSSLCG